MLRLHLLFVAAAMLVASSDVSTASTEVSKKYWILVCEVENDGSAIVRGTNANFGVPSIVMIGENCADALVALDAAGFEVNSTVSGKDSLIYTLTALAMCGDGVAEGAETCDGSDLDGNSCTSLGFDSGTLACESDCTAFDTSSCVSPGNLPNGSTCSSSFECESGFCVDGFCCNSSCGNSCDSCNVSGFEGICTVVATGSPGSPSCSPFLCDGVSAMCPVSCTTNADCASGFNCVSGACVAP